MNRKKSLIQRAFALVMALVLAGGLVPSAAWASELDYKTVTLQIALDTNNDSKNDLVVNKSYRFVGEKTLEDLFAAAKAAGDILDYEFSDNYLYSVTVTNGLGATNKADYSLYWGGYANGDYDMNGTYVNQTSALTDGETLSFGYEGYNSGPEKVDWESTAAPAVSAYFIGELTTGATLQLAYDANGDGTDEVVFNKVYGFTDGATLGDLFEAAKQAGDIKDYRFDGSEDQGYYLASVTFSDGTVYEKSFDTESNVYKYWANYKNGEYAEGTDCEKRDLLTDGTTFSFGIECYKKGVDHVGPVAADWSTAGDPVISTAVAKKSSEVTPVTPVDPEAPSVNKYDADKAALLLENLAARFKKGGADASISNTTFEAAIALNQLGMGAQIDADAILANLEKSMAEDTFSAGTYGKYILALTAAGVDCTKVTFSDGTVHNAVDEMNSMFGEMYPGVYEAVCILPVYQTYVDNTGREAKLIDAILASQSETGLFGYTGYEDSQTTAQAIVALLPYRNSRADVKDAIEKAVDALFTQQVEDGGFAYNYGDHTSNLDATSAVIVALTSLGYDCAEGQDLTTSNGSTPLGWLVAQADQDSLDNFESASNWDETMSAATAVLALTADAQFNANGSFAAYSFKTVDRSGEQAKPADDTTTNNASTTPTTTKKNVPSTGDESVAGVAVLAIAVAGGAVVFEAKRRRNAA